MLQAGESQVTCHCFILNEELVGPIPTLVYVCLLRPVIPLIMGFQALCVFSGHHQNTHTKHTQLACVRVVVECVFYGCNLCKQVAKLVSV